jgi:hypothetical protein
MHVRALKISGIGCLAIIVAAIFLIVLVGVVAHHNQAPPSTTAVVAAVRATRVSQEAAKARAYIVSHGGDSFRVQANVLNVQLAVGEAERSATQASIDQLAQAAQTAHDNIDAIRTDFTYSDTGSLGDAEGNVLLGANDLKNAMGALVAYTGNPNPATLAHFNSQYSTARAEWNNGIRVIWRLGRRRHPPTV